jgi:hypothetical protein
MKFRRSILQKGSEIDCRDLRKRGFNFPRVWFAIKFLLNHFQVRSDNLNTNVVLRRKQTNQHLLHLSSNNISTVRSHLMFSWLLIESND